MFCVTMIFLNETLFSIFSLLNRSDEIRWSLDLRWQNPKLPTGFFGLKDCVVMRTAENPNMEIDWETFDNTDRHQAAFEQIGKVRTRHI